MTIVTYFFFALALREPGGPADAVLFQQAPPLQRRLLAAPLLRHRQAGQAQPQEEAARRGGQRLCQKADFLEDFGMYFRYLPIL